MDESEPRRRWLSFGIRDMLWAIAVVGLAGGWSVNREQWRQSCLRAEQERFIAEMETLRLQIDATQIESILRARHPEMFGTDFNFEVDR